MMYSDKMVVCIKNDGKILREIKDTVLIPFNSEYEIHFKNLNSQRAVANITIDGQDIMNGSGLVIEANNIASIERFVTNNDHGNKLRFIERTKAIEDHKGIGMSDGIIRVSFKYEEPVTPRYNWPPYLPHRRGDYYWGSSYSPRHGGMLRGQSINNAFSARSITGSASGSNDLCDTSSIPMNSVNEAGVTVAGGKSDQKFTDIPVRTLELEERVIVLRLIGDVGQHKVVEAVTVKKRPKCTTCGHVASRYDDAFCVKCSTALTIY